MKDIFPHANTVVAIEESKLLKRFEYDILIDAKGLPAALGILNKANYFRTYETAEAPSYGAMLDDLTRDLMDLIKEISPDVVVWKLFALYYDIHNLKLVAKERFTGKRLDGLYLDYGSYTLPTLRSAAVRESDNILNDAVLTAGLFEALRASDMYDIDFILDKTYFAALTSYASRLGVKHISSFIKERTDLYNVSVYFQTMAAGNPEGYFRRAFSDMGSSPLDEWERYVLAGREEAQKFPLWQKYEPFWRNAENRQQLFSEFDVLRDNYLIEKTKPCKLMAFGVLPICAFFLIS